MANQQAELRAVFCEALDRKTPEERAEYLDQVCQGEPAVRARVEELLRAHEVASGFLNEPSGGLVATVEDPIRERPGTVIGPYKLLEQIGEGGFGVVFMAEQQQPVRRKVALKMLKPGMDTRQVVARFEAERQALAIMDHPHIAKIHDGGATPSGRPYFVMELVKGIPITDFCDQNQLTPQQRLELFLSVCHAVQHAHQKGIIHRDLKPSNVLVSRHDTTPVVKVIDFGVAKALGQDLTDKTLFTGIAQMIGTPLYMSPEQAGMSDLDIDTRSDIYSLGVLLYELLTGTTPFDKERLRIAGYEEIRRMIREEEAPKPSTRISTLGQAAATVSANRQSNPKKLGQLMRGELDWIVMKALEKDRNRRYETANGLARDIQRYFHDEPVQACPPSVGYRLLKFARRHKAALAMGAVVGVACAFAIGAGAASIGWTMRDRAARQAAVEIEMDGAFKEAERLQAQRKYPEALAAVRRAESLVVGGSSPERHGCAQSLRKDLEMVLRLERIRLKVPESGGGNFDFAWEEAEYAKAFRQFGINAESLEPHETADRIGATTIRIELAWALDDWAFVRDMVRLQGDASVKKLMTAARLADPDELRNRIRDAQASRDAKQLSALVHSEAFNALQWPTVNLLAVALWQTGQVEEGILLLRRAQRQHPDDFWFNYMLAAQIERKEPAQAVRFYTGALAARPESVVVQYNLARLLATSPQPGPGNPGDALELAKKAVALAPTEGDHWTVLGAAYYRAGQWEAALDALQKSMELGRGGGSFDWFFLAMTHWQLGDKGQARKWYDQAVAWMEKNQPNHGELRRFRAEAGVLLGITEKHQETQKKRMPN